MPVYNRSKITNTDEHSMRIYMCIEHKDHIMYPGSKTKQTISAKLEKLLRGSTRFSGRVSTPRALTLLHCIMSYGVAALFYLVFLTIFWFYHEHFLVLKPPGNIKIHRWDITRKTNEKNADVSTNPQCSVTCCWITHWIFNLRLFHSG